MTRGRWIKLIVGVAAAAVAGVLHWEWTHPYLEVIHLTPQEHIAKWAKIPDLHPLLTEEEVKRARIPLLRWIEELGPAHRDSSKTDAVSPEGDHVSRGPGIERDSKFKKYEIAGWQANDFSRSWMDARLPEPDRITIYSLYLGGGSSEPRPSEIDGLPRFHSQPIYGSVEITGADSCHRWREFLREQVVDGGVNQCFFQPRHGIRIESNGKIIDFVLCFQCLELRVYGDLTQRYRAGSGGSPMFTPFVGHVLNALLDKNKIKRDLPEHQG